MSVEQIPPLFVTFIELRTVFQLLHWNDPNMVSDLHDIWKQGAPSPESILRNTKGYDERQHQAGNVESRLILPTELLAWIQRASIKRGIPLSAAQAAALLTGKVRYTW